MTVIIDASVVLKLVIEESDSDRARALAASEALAAPDLLIGECANSLWVKARRKQMSMTDATTAFAAIEAMAIRTLPTHRHAATALSISFALDRSVYDCLYLAVALAEHATFVTADMVFLRAATAHANFAHAVRPLTP